MQLIQPISVRIAMSPPGTDHWLWCDDCCRFLPLERGVQTSPGWWECPFKCCAGRLLYWDSTREPEDPRWPQTTAELQEGDRSPEMHEFYKAQFQARSAALVAKFVAATGQPSHYVGEFLRMMWCCSWDLTVRDPYEDSPRRNGIDDIDAEMAASSVAEVPAYARLSDLTQAAPLLEELRSFFIFAQRTNAVSYAEQWSRALQDDGLVERLQDTMLHDLRARRPRQDSEQVVRSSRAKSAPACSARRAAAKAKRAGKRKRRARRKAVRAQR